MRRETVCQIEVYGLTFAAAGTLIAALFVGNLPWWEIICCSFGLAMVLGGGIFTVFEIRRLARISRFGPALPSEDDIVRRIRRRVVVTPDTGEACPHHESYVESPGLDQGQLTSSMPWHTPWLGELIESRRARSKRS